MLSCAVVERHWQARIDTDGTYFPEGPQCPLHVDSGLSMADRAFPLLLIGFTHLRWLAMALRPSGAALALSTPRDFSAHLVGRLVFPQPDVNRVPQEAVGRPGQIGDLDDQLRLERSQSRTGGPVRQGSLQRSFECKEGRGRVRPRPGERRLEGCGSPYGC
jgi:hypothetical protein